MKKRLISDEIVIRQKIRYTNGEITEYYYYYNHKNTSKKMNKRQRKKKLKQQENTRQLNNENTQRSVKTNECCNADQNPAKKEPILSDDAKPSEENIPTPGKHPEPDTKVIASDKKTKRKTSITRIYEKELSTKYPLPKGEGLFASYTRLREIFQQEVYRYKKETSIDKENMWNLLYERYNELFFNETDKHDVVGQKKVLDSMLRLLSAAAQEKALDQAKENDGEVSYHLDFNL